MLIVEIDQTYRYVLHMEKIWEQSEARWRDFLIKEGLPVKEVCKVIHEGRGRLQVEFYSPVSVSEVCRLFEAETSGGVTPKKDHHYKATADIAARTMTPTFTREPIVLEKGVQVKEVEKLANGQWVFLVTTGRFVGIEILFGDAEWARVSASFKDMGTRYTMGTGDSGRELPGEPSASDLNPPEDADSGKHPGPSGPFPGLTQSKKKLSPKKGFPDFPKRKPLSSYSTKRKE